MVANTQNTFEKSRYHKWTNMLQNHILQSMIYYEATRPYSILMSYMQ